MFGGTVAANYSSSEGQRSIFSLSKETKVQRGSGVDRRISLSSSTNRRKEKKKHNNRDADDTYEYVTRNKNANPVKGETFMDKHEASNRARLSSVKNSQFQRQQMLHSQQDVISSALRLNGTTANTPTLNKKIRFSDGNSSDSD